MILVDSRVLWRCPFHRFPVVCANFWSCLIAFLHRVLLGISMFCLFGWFSVTFYCWPFYLSIFGLLNTFFSLVFLSKS